MSNSKRLKLALREIESAQWQRFEEFASAFLVDEFPELRTVANPSGDEGRDSELFSPKGEPQVVLQYSVTPNWDAKIRRTAKRINTTLPEAKTLIYVSNHVIGALADKIKRDLRTTYGIQLDVRDQNYFLDRFQGVDHLEAVSESLARDIVDPFLTSAEVIDTKAQALTPGENRAAHLFLALQWEDDSRDKGLTRTAFEGLVRMALRNTDSQRRMTREQVQLQVCGVLQAREQEFVVKEVDKALAELTKRFIRHHTAEDEFCLTHEESERIKTRIAETEVLDRDLQQVVTENIKQVFPEADIADATTLDGVVSCCRVAVERFLFQRGELFVQALDQGQLAKLGDDTVEQIAAEQLREAQLPQVNPVFLRRAIERVLTSSHAAVEKYLRDVADTYTLLAFLHQTPDVQKAVRKMFSSGEIWLDTSLVLPLLSEDLLAAEDQQFRRLLRIAKEAGLRLKVSHGVVEEVERHIARSIACANSAPGDWRGNLPYLYQAYVGSGAAVARFTAWTTIFRGTERPEEDVSDYLSEYFGIATVDIAPDAARGDAELRGAVKEIWLGIHQERRQRGYYDFDPALALRLADHDSDNYVGVIVRRHQEGTAAFGYSSWWLTLDQHAFRVRELLKPYLSEKAPPSPVMSADFLTNYLAFGPLRDRVGRIKDVVLPVAIDPHAVSEVGAELVEVANAVRAEAGDLPEHVIRRKVRDALDAARRRTGRVTERGLPVPTATK